MVIFLMVRMVIVIILEDQSYTGAHLSYSNGPLKAMHLWQSIVHEHKTVYRLLYFVRIPV